MSKQRVTYDQLSLTQFVQGFTKNMLEEQNEHCRENMLQYLSDLMEDASDFIWVNAKAAHAVLLCQMERGELTWYDTEKIDRVRRVHAQKHTNQKLGWGKNEAQRRPWFCKAYQSGHCQYQKDHETNGKLQKHICSFCLNQGRFLSHPQKYCQFVKKMGRQGPVKKRARGCPDTPGELDSIVNGRQGHSVYKRNVVAHDVFNGENVEQAVQAKNHTVTDTKLQGKVRSRVFYNSNCQKRVWQGLFAKGSRRQKLKGWGHQTVKGEINIVRPNTDRKSDINTSVRDGVVCVNSVKNVACSEVNVLDVVKSKQEPVKDPKIVVKNQVVKSHIPCNSPMTQMSHNRAHVEGIAVINQPDQGINIESTDGVKHLFDINKSNADDKYLNTVLAKRNARVPLHFSSNYTNWKLQTDFDFGFVPLQDFILPAHLHMGEEIGCPLETYRRVKASGLPNFLGCRIPIESQLNVQAWDRELKGYWDNQLIHLIRHGFHLDFNRTSPLQVEGENHSSAVQYPDHVDAYLAEEMRFKAMLGPFIQNPIPNCHYSPLMSREKAGSDSRRVILDLSWPKDASVNAGIDKDSYLGVDFNLTFPTIDHITNEIKKMGRGCYLYKVDVSRAFRHVKVDPSDYDLLGVKWRDASFIDTCLPFGNRHGTQIFQRISDAVRHMMCQRGFTVLNYVDDFIGVASRDVALRSFVALRQLMSDLGLDVSDKKLVLVV